MTRKLYEAMFIVDSNRAREDYQKMEDFCTAAITRHGGEIVKAVKWDDRRLAYEINKCKRGTYVLVHFNSDTQVIGKIERQVQLSENILRCLITVDEDGVDTNTGLLARESATTESAPAAE